MSRDSESKIYVGELGNSADQDEIEKAFSAYGDIVNVWIARNPPGFAFIEFKDMRDAKDAVRSMDGQTLCGKQVVVEMANGRKRGPRGGGYRGRGRYRDSGGPGGRCYECSEYGHFAASCPNRRNGGGGGRRYNRSRSRERGYRRSRSRGSSQDRRSRSPRRSR